MRLRMRWIRNGKGEKLTRSQVAVEYLLTFISAAGIIAAVIFITDMVVIGIGNLAPAQCSFTLGINCVDMVLSSNSTSTEFALFGTSTQQYPITTLSMGVELNGRVTSAQCTTGKILPGETFVCFATLKSFQRPGQSARGNLTASIGYCGFNGGNCSTAVHESYFGTYTTQTSQFTRPQIGLVFSPALKVNGVWSMTTSFDVFGTLLYLANITLTPNPGLPPTLSVTGPGASSLNVSIDTLANYCAGMVNVTYANQTGTSVVALNASNFTGGSYKLSGNTNNDCYVLPNTTKTVSISGQNNTAGVFLLSNVSINISSTGGYNNLAVFNSTATAKIAGNNNNVTFFGSNVVLLITGTYNEVRFINSRIVNLTASGNNNLLLIHNTTVVYESITGTNDIVQNT